MAPRSSAAPAPGNVVALPSPASAPVHSEELERAALGSCLLEPRLVESLALTEADFYLERNATIWRAMVAVIESGDGLDLRTLQAKLEESPKAWKLCGGLAYLAGLDVDLPDLGRAPIYADKLRDLRARRDLARAGLEIHHALTTGRTSPEKALETFRARLADVETIRGRAHELITAPELMALDLPDLAPVIEGLITEGLAILAGKPKLGKSLAALQMALAVARGERALDFLPTHGGPVIYLALEDGRRRLKKRLPKLGGDPAPENLYFATEWRQVGKGGTRALRAKIQEIEPRLVIVDTLAKIRPPIAHGADRYMADYEALAGLQSLATELGVAIVVVTHTRKAGADDFIDQVSGSAGLTGAADAVLVMSRSRGEVEAELNLTGRDVEEKTFALERSGLGWRCLGTGPEHTMSRQRRQIWDHLLSIHPAAAWPKAIADATQLDHEVTKKLVARMLGDGNLTKTRDGYKLCMDFP